MIVEGSEEHTVIQAGERLRAKLQEGLRHNMPPPALIQRVRQTLKDTAADISLGLAIRDSRQVWMMTRGGPQVLRWSAADALAPLSPRKEYPGGLKWFTPRRPLGIAPTDRVMVASRSLAHQINSNTLLYLHANEVNTLMEDAPEEPYGAAWTGVESAQQAWTVSSAHNKFSPEAPVSWFKTELKTRSAGVILGVASLLTIIGVWLILNSPNFSGTPRYERTVVRQLPPRIEAPPTPVNEERRAKEESNTPADELRKAEIERPRSSQKVDIEGAEVTPLDQLLLAASEHGRTARTFLLGEFRESLLESTENVVVPPADLLPKPLKPFFLPMEGVKPQELSQRAEELIRTAVYLGQFDLLQDLEGQLTYRASEKHVRAWLQHLSKHSKSRVVKQWANLHLDGKQTLPPSVVTP